MEKKVIDIYEPSVQNESVRVADANCVVMSSLPCDDTFDLPQYSRLSSRSIGTTIPVRNTSTLVEISECVLVCERCR